MARIAVGLVRALVSASGATRYLITLIVTIIVLTYAVLTEANVVPMYTVLAQSLRLPVVTMFMLLYLGVLVLLTSVWYLWILRPTDSINAQISWRGVYRQTDRTGVVWLNVCMLVGLVIGAYVAFRVFPQTYMRDGAIFLATVIALPLLLDFLPAQRPRRVITTADDGSLQAIATRLRTDQVPEATITTSLMIYNELDLTMPELAGANLPEGMVIEVPPRF
jgi:hypothetical protein